MGERRSGSIREIFDSISLSVISFLGMEAARGAEGSRGAAQIGD